ncbi:uncharacterized protein LOC106638595 [Copidosoma floridanum]|uniref:uncharacterized protein LOC106638595 n=1 Tax=Copidosoma floridanum TaxID=29053 RepID=UPI000C6F9887|nr:uncharacterized protein LOC106638595 [Copidosoma floridanum]
MQRLIVGLMLSLLAPVARGGAETPKYLVYPPPADGAPTKVQLILGLGLPMEGAASTIIGYVMKSNYNLPYNASYYFADQNSYDRQQRSTEDGSLASRYEVYKLLESAFRGEGKACLLRAICEAASTPLNTSGLFAQLLHVFLTPSSTEESFVEATDQEYLVAELIGRGQRVEGQGRADACAHAFGDCGTSVLEHLSVIH